MLHVYAAVAENKFFPLLAKNWLYYLYINTFPSKLLHCITGTQSNYLSATVSKNFYPTYFLRA